MCCVVCSPNYLQLWLRIVDIHHGSNSHMGASGSVEAPDANELKRLFDKHDVPHSGKLERQEVPTAVSLLTATGGKTLRVTTGWIKSQGAKCWVCGVEWC